MSDKRICKYCGMELSEDVPHGLRECHLHAVARIAELEAERRWIPVSERLPELRVGRVDLVYTVYGEIHSAMYLGNGWTSLYRDFRSNEVTHWMPLPQPPEVQE